MNKIVLEKWDMVEKEMNKKFPGKPYTMCSSVWNDGDFRVEARYGDDKDIHIIDWYSGRGEIRYYTDPVVGLDGVKITETGQWLYIPTHLMKYLNDKTKQK